MAYINKIIMNMTEVQFFKQSPQKVLENAGNYSKTLRHFHELPKAMSKSMIVKQLAESRKEDIQYAIERSKYQVETFRKLQAEDQQMRLKRQKKIQQAAQKVDDNTKQILKKKVKQSQNYNKHLVQIYKRYSDEQKKHRSDQKQQALKLRKQLIEFYKKQQERKQKSQISQIHVATCYKNAVDRLNNIHKRNEEYSLKSQVQLNKSLQKNNHRSQIVHKQKRALSSTNRDKSKVYNQSISLFLENQSRFIQKYGHNEDHSIKALQHIDEDCSKTKKRLNQFFKKRVEKWAQQKKRVDIQNAEIPEKCSNIIDKTTKASFRKTVSAFKDSSRQWNDRVLKNKSLIKDYDENQKDKIMNLHLDLRLKNTSTSKINQKMNTMRHQARKLAYDFL